MIMGPINISATWWPVPQVDEHDLCSPEMGSTHSRLKAKQRNSISPGEHNPDKRTKQFHSKPPGPNDDSNFSTPSKKGSFLKGNFIESRSRH
ncbi:hypothetical protein AVEN_189556-1 [Araneus ventricosus]|uniref:Uncharacterized protein n=1 Tax=Araneus ventricosus TaxID=182803 RepID=A0A4Y2URY4_ARAVE|nr:hypothetical protein AVEN_189556-1 [Araneus ventricosus]